MLIEFLKKLKQRKSGRFDTCRRTKAGQEKDIKFWWKQMLSLVLALRMKITRSRATIVATKLGPLGWWSKSRTSR